MRCVQVDAPGGPEAMRLVDVPAPAPGPGQALVRLAASGVNFVDVYFRTGLYKADAPVRLGSEGAGTVEAIGSGVTEVAVGDRVAWAMIRGSYAEQAVVPAAMLVPIPDDIDFVAAAGVLLQGMTAHYLTQSTFPLKPGDACLVHAAAGGTGALIAQMAHEAGARVFGTVSTDAKAAIATAAHVDHVIHYTTEDFAAEVKRLTDGRGVDVVYDSVGQATFERSLNSLRPRGTLALFGQSSGPVPSFDPTILNAKGSLYLTRPSLAHYIATRDELLWRARDVFGGLQSGALTFRLQQTFPLAQAADAHRLLEGRGTMGKVVLTI
ncbi:MAG TPA: quinone oxidoreductase [Vicinamibacterales bacterium]|nr:quinone oxidoreductase [Vicinamibacterales bacterium]